jgi:hypothetical protein
MLSPGARLGPYEIVSGLGAGGMGEVYRARDLRLGREVALKVLSAGMDQDPERLRRFDLEARATGLLGHPNIVAVFDVGTADGVPYVVSELLEGETLRTRLSRGPLPARKALDCGIQMARGLAAAHDKGIVHRDLKPENVFLTADGHLKILDFGLAKLVPVASTAATATADLAVGTDAGVVMGTVGYMSPEQVRGAAVDHRSDIFSLGVVLYEMVSGRRPFQGASTVETMNAILKEDPPPIASGTAIPPVVDRILRRCLEKEPGERFRSAYDVSLALEAASTSGSQAAPAIDARRSSWRPVAVAVALLGALVIGALAGRASRPAAAPPPLYTQLTFGRGDILSARLTPDGNSVVYSAAWDAEPARLFTARLDNGVSTALHLPANQVLGISATGELAVKRVEASLLTWFARGSLARVPLGADTARPVADDVLDADWSPTAGDLAVLRTVAGKEQIEHPPGHVVYEAPAGGLQKIRFSPDGSRIAFGQGVEVGVVEPGGVRTLVDDGWWGGLAWSPSGREIWYGALDGDGRHSLDAVTLDGHARLVARLPDTLDLWDIGRDGKVLLSHDRHDTGITAVMGQDAAERNLSWLGSARAVDLSSDGQTLLLGDPNHRQTYLRGIEGSAPVQIGNARPFALSPDGRSMLGLSWSDQALALTPTGAGEPRIVPARGLTYRSARWMPDGTHLVVQAAEGDATRVRLYVQDAASGTFRAFTPPGQAIANDWAVSPDGQTVAARDEMGRVTLIPTAGGAPRPGPSLGAAERIARWTGDGRALFTYTSGELPFSISRVDLATGTKVPWKRIAPLDRAGVYQVLSTQLSADGATVVYTYARNLGNLYLAENLQ